LLLGLTVADFTWNGGAREIGSSLRRIASSAEEAGFARIAVMDHLWQAPVVGAFEREMLEAYTTLGFLAAATERMELLTLVTASTYRQPGLLAKMITTLDVLSGGRAWLGIGVGAGFNVAEATGLGLPFPATAERFERLEETLRICRQMFHGDETAFHGRHYHLARTLNSPAPVRRPPILVGGSGERKTLRLVAQYADACNLFAGPDLPLKLDALRRHCEEIGRDYGSIEKTVLFPLDPGPGGRQIDRLLDALTRFAKLGVNAVYGPVPGADSPATLQLLGRHVIPAAAHL
jgi:F420-dependent oxidoreductase-like protein